MKHAVPKGDKKKKKQVAMEIAILEGQLEERHQAEIENLDIKVSHVKDECKFVGIKKDHKLF